MTERHPIYETDDTPQYMHDCDGCQFLGRFRHLGLVTEEKRERFELDLYVCPVGVMGASYIARHSSEGPDYASMPESILVRYPFPDKMPESTFGPAVREAHRRANVQEVAKLYEMGWRARFDQTIFSRHEGEPDEAVLVAKYFILVGFGEYGFRSVPWNEDDYKLWDYLADTELLHESVKEGE
jgi:hypothetical protein